MDKKQFDEILKNNLVSQIGSDKFGYLVPATRKAYDLYYNQSEFSKFKNEMRSSYPEAFRSYDFGKGSELIEAAGGKQPPKMASVASSSRFCYLALRDGATAFGTSGSVAFEYECRIDGVGGTAPQLDACVPSDNIFFEVKCHEIFDDHSITLRKAYWDNIYGPENDFGFSSPDTGNTHDFQLSHSHFDICAKTTMFDIKQLLCHLMGIRSTKKYPATLIYLFFKPISDSPAVQAELDALFDSLQLEIQCIFNSKPIQNFCRKNQITLRAFAQHAYTMTTASNTNIINLFPQEVTK